jgi:hypothetical protein
MDVVTGCEVIKYDVFKDLLVIFLAIAAVVSTVIFGIMSKAITRTATSAAEIGMWKSFVGFYISCGYGYWADYNRGVYLFNMDEGLEEDLIERKFPNTLKNKLFETKGISLSDNILPIPPTKENENKWEIIDKENKNSFFIRKSDGKLHVYMNDIWMLERAIKVTDIGYDRYASQLEDLRNKMDRDSELLICRIKNNLAYYYAERQKIGAAKSSDKTRAQEFIEYIYERMNKYPRENRIIWSDDRKFVIAQFHLK